MYRAFKNYIKISLKLFIRNPITFFSIWYNFFKDFFLIKKELEKSKEKINLSIKPCLFDKENHSLKLQYYDYQNAWAFEKLLESKPNELIDIGSIITFLVFASKITKVKTIDIREQNLPIKNLETKIGDILNIPYQDNTVDFLSSLSVVEHIGLGRYGDKIDLDGMQKSINEFDRVLKKNATLLISVPIGKNNIIEFNAHRRFTPEKIYQMFKNFSIDDEVYIFKNEMMDINKYNNLGKPDAFACYKFIKN